MVAIAEDAFGHTPDRASFIEGTVNVVYRNGSGQWPGGQLVPLNKCDVHEESSGPTVEKSHAKQLELGSGGIQSIHCDTKNPLAHPPLHPPKSYLPPQGKVHLRHPSQPGAP